MNKVMGFCDYEKPFQSPNILHLQAVYFNDSSFNLGQMTTRKLLSSCPPQSGIAADNRTHRGPGKWNGAHVPQL